MAMKSPIFPIPQPSHFSDYGFDPQIDYFQVLEEARRHNKRTEPRPLDSIHFKLQKPISKDDSKHRSKSKKRKWWKTALSFWKRPKPTPPAGDFNRHSHRPFSGPVYLTESGSGSGTPCRTSRPTSGPLRAAEFGETGALPYFSLSDLNLTGGHRILHSAPSPMPIYLVT